jgi:hypothetical protein
MKILPIALAGAALATVLATAVVAQTTQTPTNPNTKVYGYKKTAPQASNPSGYDGSLGARPGRPDPDVPLYGSPKWWQDKERTSHGAGGD